MSNKNEGNKLGLKRGKYLLAIDLLEGVSVAIPTIRELSNIRVLDVEQDGSFTAHYIENFNLDGDFRTELMRFDSDLVLDTGDKKKRNKIRKAHGLMTIK